MVNAVLIALGSVALGLISWLFYSDAGGPVSAADEDLLLRQAAGLLLLGAMFWGFSLWQQIFQDPELDGLLVTPLRESEIFWRLWRRQVKWLLVFGGAVCFPAWAWLIGRAGAPDAGVAAWMFLAVPLLIEAWLIASAALGGLLATLGPLAPGLAMLSIPLVIPHTPEPGGLLGPIARPWHGEAWRAATGLPPALAALAAAVVIAVVLSAATHGLVCLTYTRGRLIARRTRRHAPSALQRLQQRPLTRGETSRSGNRPETSSRAAFLLRRLDPPTRALWQLCRGDEAPQAALRHLPWIVVVVLALAGLMRLFGPSVGEDQTGAVFIAAGTFIVVGGVMTIFLLQPSLSWYQLRSPERPPQNPSLEPLREVFPVEIQAYIKTSFVTGFGVFTLVLLLFMPFFLAGPFTVGGALRLALALWVAGLLFLGLAIPAWVPTIDPRRQPESPAKMLGSFAFAVPFFVLVFLVTRWLIAAGYLWSLDELLAFVDGHFWLAFAAFALLVLLYEGLELHLTLRRHRRRWFDAAP